MSGVGRGRLIALEGIDGCGKSTQARMLAGRLAADPDAAVGAGALLTFEPGATGLGASIRSLLLDPGRPDVGTRAEALLMAADRAQHITEVIEPALARGTWVVTDRFSASTLAYQGYGRRLDLAELDDLTTWATGGLVPDLTVLIEVPAAVAAARRVQREDIDRFEAQGDGFQQRVADGYRRLASEATTPWVVVDGTASIDAVAASVWAGLAPLLETGDLVEEGR